jgi:hypothetical protein
MVTPRQRRNHQSQAINAQHEELLVSTRRKARKGGLEPRAPRLNQPEAGPSGEPSYPREPHESHHEVDQGMDFIEEYSGHAVSPKVINFFNSIYCLTTYMRAKSIGL